MALKHNIVGRHKLTTSIAAGAAAIALAIGGYAIADTDSSDSVSGSTNAEVETALQGGIGGGHAPTFILSNAPGRAAQPSAEKTVTLTDHEQYIRHHQRLASPANERLPVPPGFLRLRPHISSLATSYDSQMRRGEDCAMQAGARKIEADPSRSWHVAACERAVPSHADRILG